MNAVRRCFLLSLMAGILPIAMGQTRQEYPVCSGALSVGEVPNNPFEAQFISGRWTKKLDGNRQFLQDPDDRPGVVARDGQGRVVERIPTTITGEYQGVKYRMTGWLTKICDPVEGTITEISYPEKSSRPTEIDSGNEVTLPAGYTGSAWVKSQTKFQTTAIFNSWHNKVSGREETGPEMFEGIPSFRYQLTRTRDEGSAHEIVNSDELFITELSMSVWAEYPSTERGHRLTHLVRKEPEASLFEIPEGGLKMDLRKRATAPKEEATDSRSK